VIPTGGMHGERGNEEALVGEGQRAEVGRRCVEQAGTHPEA